MQINPQAKIPLEDIKEILKFKTGFTPDSLIQKWKEAGVDVWGLKSKYGSKTGNVLKAVKIAAEHGLLEGSWQHPKLEDFLKTKLKEIEKTKQKEKVLQVQKEKAPKRQETKTTLRANVEESLQLTEKEKRGREAVERLRGGSASASLEPQSPPRPVKVDLVV